MRIKRTMRAFSLFVFFFIFFVKLILFGTTPNAVIELLVTGSNIDNDLMTGQLF